MRLTELEVRHFRNIRHALLDPCEGVNVLWGANAQGKTNMLEAAYYLVTGRSFRTRTDRECLPWADETPVSVVRGWLRRESGSHELLVTITPDQKRVGGDGKPIARLGMLWGRLNAVLFTPADLGIIQGAPSLRRQFLDTTLSQVSPTYLYHLQRYSHALRQRNALLRSRRPVKDMAAHFESWEAQMVVSGVEVCRTRMEHVARLEAAAAEHYGGIARSAERLTMRYSGFFKTPEALEDGGIERFTERLERGREDDASRGATSVGPHRDDFIFALDGHDLRDYGSQGQQRSAILALRLAEVDVMGQRAGEPPVLLLDDIIGELDPERTAAFLKRLSVATVQTIITATQAADVSRHIEVERLWRVESGEFALVNAGANADSCSAS
jgi:DNA replication and repair protein RecF